MAQIFIAGGTGYMGRALIPKLVECGHAVKALVRPGSEGKLPSRCEPVSGDALDRRTFQDHIAPAKTFVQLVGVAHPGPAKAGQFRTVDLVSVRESVPAAVKAGIRHFIYLSVAQPAPVMKAYQAVRAEGEALIRDAGLSATILRPWYVLGPGHWWPYLVLPGYWLFQALPSTRQAARRLGLVTLPQMVAALLRAVEDPPQGVRVVEVPEIRAAAPLK